MIWWLLLFLGKTFMTESTTSVVHSSSNMIRHLPHLLTPNMMKYSKDLEILIASVDFPSPGKSTTGISTSKKG
uniref:Putative ovule protein n=1 Tax=Solanum chacoense TaxID=4108 RepID=A0A0V0HPU6_SOLCH